MSVAQSSESKRIELYSIIIFVTGSKNKTGQNKEVSQVFFLQHSIRLNELDVFPQHKRSCLSQIQIKQYLSSALCQNSNNSFVNMTSQQEDSNTNIGSFMMETIVIQSDLNYQYFNGDQSKAQNTLEKEINIIPQVEVKDFEEQKIYEAAEDCQLNPMHQTRIFHPFFQQMERNKQRMILSVLRSVEPDEDFKKHNITHFSKRLLSYRMLPKQQREKLNLIMGKIFSKVRKLRAQLSGKHSIVNKL